MSNVKIYQFGGTSPAPWYRVGGINQMVGYAIVTGNGKIILIDGGYDDDAAYLLRYLKYLAGGKPTISAWFFTHLHGDHTDAFAEIVKNRFDEIEIDIISLSFTSTLLVSDSFTWTLTISVLYPPCFIETFLSPTRTCIKLGVFPTNLSSTSI